MSGYAAGLYVGVCGAVDALGLGGAQLRMMNERLRRVDSGRSALGMTAAQVDLKGMQGDTAPNVKRMQGDGAGDRPRLCKGVAC